jgi:hypothetical protein
MLKIQGIDNQQPFGAHLVSCSKTVFLYCLERRASNDGVWYVTPTGDKLDRASWALQRVVVRPRFICGARATLRHGTAAALAAWQALARILTISMFLAALRLQLPVSASRFLSMHARATPSTPRKEL